VTQLAAWFSCSSSSGGNSGKGWRTMTSLGLEADLRPLGTSFTLAMRHLAVAGDPRPPNADPG
jgi:hypothetical protein